MIYILTLFLKYLARLEIIIISDSTESVLNFIIIIYQKQFRLGKHNEKIHSN